ncbi:TPA: ATP-binding protein [Klebsiella oxytoca]|nr:ATP-binding protein [Klebsiella oxytoca]
MFRIKSIMNEGRDKIYVHDISEDSGNNYYSILTGDNASGKSSLLSKAINFFLFSNKRDEFLEPAIELSSCSESYPSKIIALCNSRFDKFTSKNFLKTKDNQRKTIASMNYIHPELSDNSRRGISGIVDQCLKNTLRNTNATSIDKSNQVQEAFSMFGLQSHLHLKCVLDTKNITYILAIISGLINGQMILSDESIKHARKSRYLQDEELKNRNIKLDESIAIICRESENKLTLDVLCDILLMLEAGKFPEENLNDIYFSVAKGRVYSERKSLVYDFNGIDIIKYLFILDVINVSDFQVMHLNTQKEVSIISLSSGQITLFGHAIVLSSFAEKNCMVCIDEPENSLHPEWQLNFMRFISLLCPDTLGAHIFIATHSPQIISGMRFDNGCVLSLVNRDNIELLKITDKKDDNGGLYELQPLKIYREQSADKQLTGVFKSPGYKNDFIIRKLLLILSKASKKINFTKNDDEFIGEIVILFEKKRIPEGDPVQLLFKQVLSFQKARNSDD